MVSAQSNKGLKDYYRAYFPIGVAISVNTLNGDQGKLLLSNFNSVTPENAMKMGPIHPEENRYNWHEADSIVAFAQQHGLKVRGHNLCWHEQTPKWLFKTPDGGQVSKDVLLKRLKDHITTVVKRYKGKIYAWDVVNEAVDDDSTKFLRNSAWYKICGEDFIAKAFEYAHDADPKAILFYNDYNTERPEKRDRVYKLLKKLRDAGVPVNGVGLQAHWSVYEPTAVELRTAIKKFSSLGLKIQFTEVDVSIFEWEKSSRPLKAGEIGVLTPELEKKQTDKYAEIFKIFREFKKDITGVTFWNLSDQYSWLDEYPVKGRKNFPLLFDQNLRPKKAYWSVVNF